MSEELYWYWLTNIQGIGRKTIHKLLDKFHTPQAVYEAQNSEILSLIPSKHAKQNFISSKNEALLYKKYVQLEEQNVHFLHQDLEEYPLRFRDIPDAPYSLYIKGNMPAEDAKAVAIIGSRECTRYGKEMARFFGRELASCGIAIISGLARGIDAMAHIGALEANGYTLGIVAGGVDRIYPQENYQLFMQMEREGGILSESNLGIAPTAGLFPQRNRLIAGMSDGILVIEAMEKSGTFITVDQGLEQGKEIFALPGRIMDKNSAGCNNLIKMGAHMVTDVADILEILQINKKNVPKVKDYTNLEEVMKKKPLAPLEKMVYSCLRIEPKYLDDIIIELQIAPQEVCMALNQMLINGIIVEPVRNYYAIRL